MSNWITGLSVDHFPTADAVAGAPDTAQDDLLCALQAGVEQAYEILIHRFQQPVYNLVFRLLNDPSDASDVVQEVFLKVFRNIGSFRGQSSLKTWIYRIAVHEAYNHRRWFCRHRKMEVGLDADDDDVRSVGEQLHDPSRTPYELTLAQERHELIESALREVNPVFRTAVILRDIEDLSYEEIADILQISLGTVKSRILRGREGLRKAIESRMQQHPAALDWNPQIAE